MLTSDETNKQMGIIFLRIALGTMWIAHALLKLTVYTIPGFSSWLASQGLPAMMAWPVFLLELVGGIAILVGLYGRYVSAILLPILLIASWTHFANGWLHTNTGGGWEYPLFLIFSSIAHILFGDGKFALTSRHSLLPAR